MISEAPRLRTPGVIAKELGEPLHRVEYILRTRPHIVPSARAGQLRLYSREAVSLICHELSCMAARREVGVPRDRSGGGRGK